MLLKFKLDKDGFTFTNPADLIAAESIDYIKCHFDITDTVWKETDAIIAVFKSATYNKHSEVLLDSYNNCYIDPEVYKRGGRIQVKLVGDKYLNDTVISSTTITSVLEFNINENIIVPLESPSKYSIAIAELEKAKSSVDEALTDLAYKLAHGELNGVGIDHIVYNLDGTVTITLSDGTVFTSEYSMKGATGNSGVYYGPDEPIDPDIFVWVNPDGEPTFDPLYEIIDAWMEAHPEATTTVQDGSLTEAKFTDALKLKTIKEYVTPEMFGAKGDGVTDDTEAIKAAINEGSVIMFLHDYAVSDDIEIPSNRVLLGNDHTVIRKTEGNITESIFLIAGAHNVIVKDLYINANYPYTNRITDESNYNTYRNNAKGCLEITAGSYDVYVDHVCSSYGLTGFSIGSDSYNVTIVNSSSINTLADGVHMGQCHNCAVINHYCEGCQDDAFSCNTYTDSSHQPHDNIYDCCRSLNCYGRGFNTSGKRIKFTNGICLKGNMVPVNFETRVSTAAEDCEVSNSFFTTVNEQSSSTLNTKKKLLLTGSTSASKRAKNCRINNSVLQSEQDSSAPNILFVEGDSVFFNNVTIKNYVLYSVGALNIYNACKFLIYGGIFCADKTATLEINNSIIETQQSAKADSQYCMTVANCKCKLRGNEYINAYSNPAIRFGGSTANPVTLFADTNDLSLSAGGAGSANLQSSTFISKTLADSSNTVLSNGQLVLDETNNVAYLYIGTLKAITA